MRPCRQPAAGEVTWQGGSEVSPSPLVAARRGGATDRHGVPIGALHHLAHGRTSCRRHSDACERIERTSRSRGRYVAQARLCADWAL